MSKCVQKVNQILHSNPFGCLKIKKRYLHLKVNADISILNTIICTLK